MIETILGLAALAVQDPGSVPTADEPVLLEAPASEDKVIPVTVAAPPGRQLNAVAGYDISLDVSEDESELILGYTWAGSTRAAMAGGRSVRLARQTFELALSLPVGGSDNLLSRDTHKGLKDGPSLTAAWTWFGTKSADRLGSQRFRGITQRAYERCMQGLGPKPLTASQCELRRDNPRVDFAEGYSGVGEAKINRALFSAGYAVGISGSIGVNTFDFRTPVTLGENSRTKPQFSVKSYATLFPSDGMSMLTASVEYLNEFEAADEEIICKPIIVAPNDDCVKAAAAGPSRVERLNLAAEYRRVIGPVFGIGELAMAPAASVDALSGEFEVSFPLFLSPDKDLGLLPGVSVSYSSEEDDVVFGVFLKKSFGF